MADTTEDKLVKAIETLADTTEDKLVKAIETLADKIDNNTKSDDALKFTQAALNAAHTIQVIKQGEYNTRVNRIARATIQKPKGQAY